MGTLSILASLDFARWPNTNIFEFQILVVKGNRQLWIHIFEGLEWKHPNLTQWKIPVPVDVSCWKNVEIIPIKKGWFQAKERRLQPWAEVWTIIYPIQVMRSVMDITIYSKKAFAAVGWNRRCLVVLPQDFFVGGHNMTVWCWIELSPKAKWLALKSDEFCHFCQISAEPEDDLDLPVGAATWLHKIYQNIMCCLKAKQYGKTHSIGILFGHPKGSPTMAAF